MSSSDRDSFLSANDPLSINEEIQQLNPDVIDEVARNDDLMGSNRLMKTFTAGSHSIRTDAESAIEPYQPNYAFGHIDDADTNTNATTGGNDGNSLKTIPTPTGRRRSTIAESIMRTSTFQKISKFSWWDSDFKRDRIKVYYEFLTNYLLLCVILTVILCIYWGTYYNRESRFKNLKFLVVNDDLPVNGITPIIGDSVNITANNPTVQYYGNWELFSHDEFEKIASTHNNTIYEEIKRQVHHQNYWAAIYVRPNVTSLLYDAIQANDTSFNVTGNLVEVVYETGRDLLTMSSYVSKFLVVFEKAFLTVVKQEFAILVNQLSSDEEKVTALSFLSKPFSFYYNDLIPVTGSILLAPLQLGLTFLVVFAFFNLLMTIRIQIYISTLVTGFKYVLLRTVISHISYAVISLGYLLVNLAFGIDTTATFGRSGALVLWAIGFLTMAALGSLNEVVALLCFTYYPKLIGGWLVFLMAANVAPTVSPLALCNHFFRYGYAMPIHNSYEAAKVVFCDIYKGQLGRNIGILIAWDVLFTLVTPITLIHVAKVRARREAQEKEAAAAAAATATEKS